MAERGTHSYREITTQAAAWQAGLDVIGAQRDALAALLEANRERGCIFIGCGSTHCLAQFAAPFFQDLTDRLAVAAPSSELIFHPWAVVPRGAKPLVVALSRSGETTETVVAVEAMRRAGCDALAISCYGDTPLSQTCDITLEIAEGREESYAQTRSFAGMLMAAQALAAVAAGDEALMAELEKLPALAGDILERSGGLAKRWGSDESYKRVTYLGSGALYGLAAEAAIKMKEMSLSVAEPCRFLEFRHGPMSLADEEHLVVGLVSESMARHEIQVLREAKHCGARVLAIANEENGLADACDEALVLQAPVSELARALLYLPFLQLVAYHRALARGVNPDRPRNVTMAVTLDRTSLRP